MRTPLNHELYPCDSLFSNAVLTWKVYPTSSVLLCEVRREQAVLVVADTTANTGKIQKASDLNIEVMASKQQSWPGVCCLALGHDTQTPILSRV